MLTLWFGFVFVGLILVNSVDYLELVLYCAFVAGFLWL